MTQTTISTTARRIARASREGWTVYFDAEGHEVDAKFDTTGKVFGPRNDTYAMEVSGKIAERPAQDMVDAYSGLAALGYSPGVIRQNMPLVLADWDFSDECGKPRSEVAEIADRMSKL
ncbi:hypothetical protein [Nocardia fluminea]|uniref:hypothetical protein n=1 Tax=Nocardia fluminea TaxID=134984 RepID=UPI0036696219